MLYALRRNCISGPKDIRLRGDFGECLGECVGGGRGEGWGLSRPVDREGNWIQLWACFEAVSLILRYYRYRDDITIIRYNCHLILAEAS